MSTAEPVTSTRHRRGLEVSLVVAVVGLLMSGYLSVEHFTTPALLACPEGATLNCAKVTSSAQSVLLGVPVAVLGLVYFAAMTVLTLPAAWQIRRLDPVRVLGAVAGTAMVIYLVVVELFVVNAICLWCTGVHLCTLALLGAILWRFAGRPASS